MSDDAVRDWRPGDGIRCRYAKRAPPEIPCGQPVQTRITTYTATPGGQKVTNAIPLCANHTASWDALPNRLHAKAEQIAREQLIAAHYEEYAGYLRLESERLVDQAKHKARRTT